MQGTAEKARYWLIRNRIPFTKSLLAINLLTFLLVKLFHTENLLFYLGFMPAGELRINDIWTAVTYPLLGCGDVLCLFLAGYWLWVAGGSLERSWGSFNFAVFFFVTSALTAASLAAGSHITGVPVELFGVPVPLAAITVAFGALNPEQEILFLLLIPLKLKYVAMIGVAILFIDFGSQHLLLGVFSLAGCVAAYCYVRAGIRLNLGRGSRISDKVIRFRQPKARRRFPSPLRWYKEYCERRWLKKFLKK
jgi:membrane associated rhomboid family serine protease